VPVFESRDALCAAVGTPHTLAEHAPFLHVLTHKDLHLHPVATQLPKNAMPHAHGDWFDADAWTRLGLPAPVRKLLELT
jgi:A/G-specific adenine glycosylase